MPNAKDATTSANERILLVGRTGSGKTAQIWTLPGRKFAYIFDPNSLKTLQGMDLEYEIFLPEILELDATLKGFNKGAKDDKPATKREPQLYNRWIEDINERADKKFFADFDWLVMDSLTFLSKAVMDRQQFINGRYGGIEELGDYRVVGSKIADVFGSITSLPQNLLCTGHIDTYQDEKTAKIETQIRLPGRARSMLPLMFTNIWKAEVKEGEKGKVKFVVRTQPEPRGLLDIRCSIPGLAAEEDVTIPEFNEKAAGRYGIGKLLEKGN